MRIGFFLLIAFCVGIQIGILSIFMDVISTTSPGNMRSTIAVSALLVLIFTLFVGLEYLFISNIVFSSSLYVDGKGMYTDHQFIPWGAIVKIRCWHHGNVPAITIRYRQNGKKKKRMGALPIFNARHYADIVQSLYENQGRNWSQIIGYGDNSWK